MPKYDVRTMKNLLYIGKSTRHLGTTAGYHLNLDDSHKNAINNCLQSSHQCCNRVCSVTSFNILRKCHADYDTEIYEASSIKN